ncbi:MAG: hypothetical protein CMP48_07615 [Rickettsiales bacterium]|nr:hypothetical protein [Rickettsiales bacterium]
MRKVIVIATLLLTVAGIGVLMAQPSVYVDEQGLMRWTDTRKEVQGFGVNYTVPFAHAYRSAQQLGVDPKEVIDEDVYHFARLSFDAYRVHVWDTQISDSVGNLLENEHLEVFDYMLKKMQDRGMKMLITPIAFWGNGWPERDSWTPGFSHKYGKDNCLTNEEAIKAQEKYLIQFLNHVNPYTGMAYKNDPNIVAFEVSNEPHHRQSPDSVKLYVKKMVDAMKSTGCEKPIFYNISHGINYMDQYFEVGIDGGTFQWYPTGLGAGEELKGNFLPHVDHYEIPFADHTSFKGGAKVVYEFDAADVGRSYIYPAMARSFRTAGIQWATHFAYDPTFLAYANTEYNTHYMNLQYTPQKALALKIAGEVFHQIPVYTDFGQYPANSNFGDFLVSYEKDLAIMNSDEEFIYTNHNEAAPKDIKKLKSIAGWGNSKVVKYNGTGAYFLDEISKGIWRLEVLPDAVWVSDPFGKNSLDRKLAEIVWQSREMSVELPSLGADFSITPINDGNLMKPEVRGNSFTIEPGTYLLVRNGLRLKIDPNGSWKNIRLNEFVAHEETIDQIYVLHDPVEFANEGEELQVKVKVVSDELPEKVTLVTYVGWKPVKIEMSKKHGFDYSATIPADLLKKGVLKYFIEVDNEVFPEGIHASISDWDFDSKPFDVSVIAATEPLYLYNAFRDEEEVSREWKPGSFISPSSQPDRGELVLKIDQLFTPDPENPEGNPVYDYSLRYNFKQRIEARKTSLRSYEKLVLNGRNLQEGEVPVQVALIMKDASTYGGIVRLSSKGDYSISLDDLKPVQMVTLPRPYPSFLPYYFEGSAVSKFDIEQVETVQISLGPGLSKEVLTSSFEIAIESVRLE